MTPALTAWQQRHAITPAALADLLGLMGYTPECPAELTGKNEAYVQSAVRLAAAPRGIQLFRNNVGALKDDRGAPVRYGLANDSPALNKAIKSADLIGWRPVMVRHLETGEPMKIAQFTSIECKRAGWIFNPKDEREIAQNRWLQMVLAAGGCATFSTGGLPL